MVRNSLEWRATRDVREVDRLHVESQLKGPISATHASIEVAVSRSIDAGVRGYISAGNRYRHRVVLAPPDGIARDAVHDPETSNAWARQISEVLVGLADRSEVASIDLFMACPVELALSIGWWANAAGAINLMNWRGKNGPYEPMWTLP